MSIASRPARFLAFTITVLAPAAAHAQLDLSGGQSVHTDTAGGPIALDDSGSGLVAEIPGTTNGPIWLAPTDDGAGFTVSLPGAYPAGGTVDLSDGTSETLTSIPSTDTFVTGGMVWFPAGSGLEASFPNAGGIDLSGSGLIAELPQGAPPLDLSNDGSSGLVISFFAQPDTGMTIDWPAGSGLVVTFPPETVVSIPTGQGPLDLSGPDLVITTPADEPFATAYPLTGEMVVNFARGSIAVSGYGVPYVLTGPIAIADETPASAPRVENDSSGDGVADLVWQAPYYGVDSSTIYRTVMHGQDMSAHLPLTTFVPFAYSGMVLAGTGDVDGDGTTDLVAEQSSCAICGSTSFDVIRLTSGGAVRSTLNVAIDRIHTTGDFNGDGKIDLVTRNPSTGAVKIVEMNGTATPRVKTFYYSLPGGAYWSYYVLKAAGDFDGDGKADLLWQSTAYGNMAVTLSRDYGGYYYGSTYVVNATATDPYDHNPLAFSGWSGNVIGTGDFNRDGKDDVAFKCSDYKVCVAQMNGGAAPTVGKVLSVNHDTPIYGVGDYNGDGKADLAFKRGGFQSNGSYPQYCAPYELSNQHFCGSWTDGVAVMLGNGIYTGPVQLATPGAPGTALPAVGAKNPNAGW